jgi:endonuclease III
MQKFKMRKTRIKKLDNALKKLFPRASTELNFKTPWELLVAVQLSAQCTDKMVNRITKKLFKKYKSLNAYVKARPKAFEEDIRSSGFYRAKTRNILKAAKIIKRDFDSQVPKTMEELVKLPGVARKTANVVLSEAFGKVVGVTVDRHVIRFVRRFDISDHSNPVEIEKDLMELLPKREWRNISHRLIHYGRYMAPARKYDTSQDPLVTIYPPAANRYK